MLWLLAAKISTASIDAIYSYGSKNIYFVCPALGSFYPFNSLIENKVLDSIINSVHRKDTTLRVLVVINMGVPYPSYDVTMAYDELGVRQHDGTLCIYNSFGTGDVVPKGLLIYYNSNQPGWREIINLIEYGAANIDDVKKYQQWICRSDTYYDPVLNGRTDSLVNDTAGITIDRVLLQKVKTGTQGNEKPRFENPNVQRYLNIVYCIQELLYKLQRCGRYCESIIRYCDCVIREIMRLQDKDFKLRHYYFTVH